MSKKLRPLFALFLVVLLTSCSQAKEEQANNEINYLETDSLFDESVYWYGRNHLQDEQVYFYYPSTGFQTTFIGSALNITLSLTNKNADIYFSLALDGEPLLDAQTVILSERTQTIRVTFDTYGEHTVQLIKRSEPRDGVTSLLSLETNGEFIKTTRPTEDTPHFLLIGASGLSGNGALGQEWENRTTANSSSLHSFGYLTAKRFNGTYEFVSNSGWGLLYGFNDKTGNTNIMDAYEHVGIDANQEIVDSPYTAQTIPDIIIVNIGGNDYSSVINRLSGFEREDKIKVFKQAVTDFIYRLREEAPDAHIFWTMTSGSQNGKAAQSVIDLLPEHHQDYVHMVIINGVGEDGPVGANNHASYETHISNADILEEAIKQYTELNNNE